MAEPVVTKRDVAMCICALVAAAKLAEVPLIDVLAVVAETYETDIVSAPESFRAAADLITG